MPLTCFISLSQDKSVCNEISKVKINGVTDEEKKEFCNTVFELNSNDKLDESESFSGLDQDSKNLVALVIAIQRNDAGICSYIQKESINFISCIIFTNFLSSDKVIDQGFCSQYNAC